MSALDTFALKVTRPYREEDLPAMAEIWNEVVEAGNAFPQTKSLTLEEARAFFAEQPHAAVATVGGRICGLYILHPNNIGRCGHVANASFARGGGQPRRGHRALACGRLSAPGGAVVRGLQFNAVVASNERARSLYESLGFARIGMIPGGFCNKDDVYEDMYIYYHPTV